METWRCRAAGNQSGGARLSHCGENRDREKIGPDGKYIDKYVAYTAGVAPASRPQFALVVVINDPSNGAYYGGRFPHRSLARSWEMCCGWKM